MIDRRNLGYATSILMSAVGFVLIVGAGLFGSVCLNPSAKPPVDWMPLEHKIRLPSPNDRAPKPDR